MCLWKGYPAENTQSKFSTDFVRLPKWQESITFLIMTIYLCRVLLPYFELVHRFFTDNHPLQLERFIRGGSSKIGCQSFIEWVVNIKEAQRSTTAKIRKLLSILSSFDVCTAWTKKPWACDCNCSKGFETAHSSQRSSFLGANHLVRFYFSLRLLNDCYQKVIGCMVKLSKFLCFLFVQDDQL